ncbi:hypothetical protein GIB67_019102 [Kingdonia uniflora]|uniref:K-box domain-containing protein n=1 Tax=Kingdonia uniflora TaxID=39325 RepID=A0A7J7MZL1_9MAGN|nr:hypothetical protein GIB67_019102 [Kingdonia uniflora]
MQQRPQMDIIGTSPECMNRTLERYQRVCFNPQDSLADRETQSWYHEVSKLKAKYDSLQRAQRHLLGEDLGPLSVKELQNLEKQLEGALAQARQRRTEIMVEQMEELRRKERHLGDINKQLRNKLETEGPGSLRTIQASWETSALASNTAYNVHQGQSTLMDCEPTLQIGYHHYVQQQGASTPRTVAGESNFMQGWAL